ncbi:MAG: hypothetical protein AWM53_00742 [Candidatus Dichloromethanomonas elyunquensis]|nr:MAG: hypothetical protein AWM53_00742 [Candidatus Dichloromethanomonas elyunquensis]
MHCKTFCFNGDRTFEIHDFDTKQTGEYKNKEEAEQQHEAHLTRMQELQDKLYAENKEALLIIFQAMDAAGKDGAIKHVMSGMNPQGIDVYNFKKPSTEELDHDYLWRAMRVMPERGKICIFNRSYYEDVLIGKVHNLYKDSNLPDRCKSEDIFEERYHQIKNYEKYLYENGIRVIKFFLHISKEEQTKRFLERIEDENKNWKFSDYDMIEREYWDDYMAAYNDAIKATATGHSPWYVVPANTKWFARLVISEVIIKALEDIDPKYPAVSKERKEKLLEFGKLLSKEY